MDNYIDNYLNDYLKDYGGYNDDVDSSDPDESYEARQSLRSSALKPPDTYTIKQLTPEEANSMQARKETGQQQTPYGQEKPNEQQQIDITNKQQNGDNKIFSNDLTQKVADVNAVNSLARSSVASYANADLPGSETAKDLLKPGSTTRTASDTVGGAANMFMGARAMIDGSGEQRVGGGLQLARGVTQVAPNAIGAIEFGGKSAAAANAASAGNSAAGAGNTATDGTTIGSVVGKAAQGYQLYQTGKNVKALLDSGQEPEAVLEGIKGIVSAANPVVGAVIGIAETAWNLYDKRNDRTNIEIPSITTKGAFSLPEWDKPVINYEVNQQIRDNDITFDKNGVANKKITWTEKDRFVGGERELSAYARVDTEGNLILSEEPFKKEDLPKDVDLSGKHFIQKNADIQSQDDLYKDYRGPQDFIDNFDENMKKTIAAGGQWRQEDMRFKEAFEPIAQVAEQLVSGLQTETKNWLQTLPPEKRAEAEMDLEKLEITYADPHSKGHTTISTKRAGSFKDDAEIFLSRLVVDYTTAVLPIMEKYGVKENASK